MESWREKGKGKNPSHLPTEQVENHKRLTTWSKCLPFSGSCSLAFQFRPSFVVTVSILCNPSTGSLTAGHSITPSLAVFSMTNRCVPAKLLLNKWMCFLTPDQTWIFAEPDKPPCCLSLQRSTVYLTPEAIGVFQEDRLIHQLPILCSVHYK